MEDSKQLSRDHHAYRERCSTTMALIQLMDTIVTARDDNLTTAIMNIDQSTEFDCIEHAILKEKLKYLQTRPEGA